MYRLISIYLQLIKQIHRQNMYFIRSINLLNFLFIILINESFFYTTRQNLITKQCTLLWVFQCHGMAKAEQASITLTTYLYICQENEILEF